MSIRLTGITVSANDGTPLLEDIDLELSKPGIYGIHGKGGAGKTTLAYCMSGIIPKFLDYTYSGTVEIDDKSVSEIPRGELGHTTGIVFQNPDYQLFFHRVNREIGFPVGFDEEKVKKIADSLGIESLLKRSTSQLSYGEKKLVILASNLSMDPSLLILDEVFSSLDPFYSRRIFDLLKKLSSCGLYVVLIENSVNKFPGDISAFDLEELMG